MATIIVAFGSEKEAKDAISKLSEAGLGEVRARVLESTEPLSHEKQDNTSPMIVPELGSIEVRPQETPKTPEPMHEGRQAHQSATIPAGDQSVDGVQVMIETDDINEGAVRRLLGLGEE